MKYREIIEEKYELFKIAGAKGYYKPAAKATVTEVDSVKTELQA